MIGLTRPFSALPVNVAIAIYPKTRHRARSDMASVEKKGKKVCKTTVVRCYQSISLHFLLAKVNWLENNSYIGHLLTALFNCV